MKGLILTFWVAIDTYTDLLSGKPVRFFTSLPEAGRTKIVEVSADLSILEATFGKGSEPYMGDKIEFSTIALKGV